MTGGRRRWNTYESLVARAVKNDRTGCLLWTGPLTKGGYAKGSMWNQTILVHRYIYIASLFEDRLADEYKIYDLYHTSIVIMHTCDVPRCISPEHLVDGSYKENIQDAIQKGRWQPRRGELSNFAKLTEQEALAIKIEAISEDHDLATIADRYGISKQQVSRIVSGKRWPHL